MIIKCAFRKNSDQPPLIQAYTMSHPFFLFMHRVGNPLAAKLLSQLEVYTGHIAVTRTPCFV